MVGSNILTEKDSRMRLAKWTFRTAGIFGLIVMVPMLFIEKLIEQIMEKVEAAKQ